VRYIRLDEPLFGPDADTDQPPEYAVTEDREGRTYLWAKVSTWVCPCSAPTGSELLAAARRHKRDLLNEAERCEAQEIVSWLNAIGHPHEAEEVRLLDHQNWTRGRKIARLEGEVATLRAIGDSGRPEDQS
jgi:hypothetical protein